MVEAPAERYDEMIDLAVRRSPALIRAFVEPLFHDPDFTLESRFVVALDGDRMLGWGGLAKLAPFPPGWRSLRIVVDAEQEGAGVGSALHATLVDGIDDDLVLRSGVFDDEPRALEVAQHWGFGILQHSISSRLPLPSPVPERALPDDVTVEASTSLEFPDQDAFDAMLDASQTNPERDQFVFDRAMLLDFITDKERPLGVLLRVGGRPAAISWGSAFGDQAHIGYTGVDPAFRGRGLGYLVKQEIHRLAYDAGARDLYDRQRGAQQRHPARQRGTRLRQGVRQLLDAAAALKARGCQPPGGSPPGPAVAPVRPRSPACCTCSWIVRSSRSGRGTNRMSRSPCSCAADSKTKCP